MVVLENHAQPVTLGQCRLWLVGVGDLWEGHPDIPRAFADVNDDAPVIAITHNPDLFPQMPARASLVVAGHTHGGQVWLLPGRPSKRGLHYLAGKFVEDGRHLFVTPGIGTSIMPFRFRVPPEISRLTLRAARIAPGLKPSAPATHPTGYARRHHDHFARRDHRALRAGRRSTTHWCDRRRGAMSARSNRCIAAMSGACTA